MVRDSQVRWETLQTHALRYHLHNTHTAQQAQLSATHFNPMLGEATSFVTIHGVETRCVSEGFHKFFIEPMSDSDNQTTHICEHRVCACVCVCVLAALQLLTWRLSFKETASTLVTEC